jgi:RNA polymerase sigma factor, sigma-70 family
MDAEKELIKALTSGKPRRIKKAFGSFYNSYYRLVWKVVREQFQPNSYPWFEDAVDEAFVAVLTKISKGEGLKNPKIYLLQSARNIALAMYGSQRAKGPSGIDEDSVPSGQGDEVKKALEDDETLRRIHEILPPPDDEIFILKEGYELSFLEIAQKLNLGEDFVYYHYKKSLKKLRKEFGR